MAQRTLEEVVAMRRRDLARLHANELNAALFPEPERHDDAIADEEKAEIQVTVAEIRERHRQELAAWVEANS
jgi:hypothetical protein